MSFKHVRGDLFQSTKVFHVLKLNNLTPINRCAQWLHMKQLYAYTFFIFGDGKYFLLCM